MNDFTLQRIKKTQLASFQDTCTIDTFTSGSNVYREIIESYTSGSEINCGHKSNTASKSYGESEQKLKYAAIFRIDDSETITEDDRITLTKISGSSITPKQYKVSTLERGKGIYIVGCDFVEV